MSEFKRPAGALDDPEHAYRSGYQDGFQACLETLRGRLTAQTKATNHPVVAKIKMYRTIRTTPSFYGE